MTLFRDEALSPYKPKWSAPIVVWKTVKNPAAMVPVDKR
jgi:hypothetical protein